jgi:hypothetical protein
VRVFFEDRPDPEFVEGWTNSPLSFACSPFDRLRARGEFDLLRNF